MTLPGDELHPNLSDQQDSFIKSLALFTQQHRAGHWSGQFSAFMHEILALAPERVARSSHQYIWDMSRATFIQDSDGHYHCKMFEDEVFGIDEAIDRVID